MFTHQIQIRVRYAETDQMGYVYYGNYATYYEVARVESLRSLGLTYKEMEEGGIMLPVVENLSKYKYPAQYDDLLTIKTHVKELPSTKIIFNYDIFNEQDLLINTGQTVLVFVDKQTRKVCACPASIKSVFEKFFF